MRFSLVTFLFPVLLVACASPTDAPSAMQSAGTAPPVGAASIDMPQALQCQATTCVYGDSQFCNADLLGRLSLSNLQQAAAVRLHQAGESRDGMLLVDPKSDKVKIDFASGDQYAIFTFRKDDILALNDGSTARLRGSFEDAYDWADGYHTRALFALECQK